MLFFDLEQIKFISGTCVTGDDATSEPSAITFGNSRRIVKVLAHRERANKVLFPKRASARAEGVYQPSLETAGSNRLAS